MTVQLRARLREKAGALGITNASAVEHLVQQESGFDPAARPIGKDGKQLSSAFGLFQILGPERQQLGLGDNADPEAQMDAWLPRLKQKEDAARAVLGRDPTPGEFYLMHYQGTEGGKALLKADPSRNVQEVLNEWGNANGAKNWGDRVLKSNPWLAKTPTVGEFIGWADKKMGGQGAASTRPFPKGRPLPRPVPRPSTDQDPVA